MSKIFKFSVRHGIFLHWKRVLFRFRIGNVFVLFCFVLFCLEIGRVFGNMFSYRQEPVVTSSLYCKYCDTVSRISFVNELLLCLDPAARQNT